jgi:hypothetical protein
MAALTITAANVSLDSGPHDADCIAGEAFNAGAGVYLKASDGKWYKAQCDGTAEEAGSQDSGIALFTASGAGARGAVAKRDAVVSVGSAVCAAGIPYFAGATAGSLNPIGDLVSTNLSTLMAIGYSTSKLKICREYNAAFVIA